MAIEDTLMNDMTKEAMLIDTSMYEDSGKEWKVEYDRRAADHMRALYASDMKKHPSINLTFDQWFTHMSESKTQPDRVVSQLNRALQDDVKGSIGSEDRFKISMGDDLQNVWGNDYGAFISSAMRGIQAGGGLERDVPIDLHNPKGFGKGPSMEKLHRNLNKQNLAPIENAGY